MKDPSLASFMLPGGISKIKWTQRLGEDDESFFDDLEQIETTMAGEGISLYDSRSTIPRGRMDSAATDRRMTRNGRTSIRGLTKSRKKKHRNSGKKKYSKAKARGKGLNVLEGVKLGGADGLGTQLENLGDLRRFMHGYGNSRIMEMESETESELEDERRGRRVKKIVFKNDIGKIDQKINVSNFNCSCRVF